jgi:hypothetical protein
MAKMVQCVPGGHQIPIEKAYWCNECNQYLCFLHGKSHLGSTFTCRKGHKVSKAT